MPQASCPRFPTLPFLAFPRTPLAHVSCPRFRTLPFLACPGAPQSTISYASCPRFPTLPLLACPQCRMPLLSPTALLLQRKGSLLLLAAAILDRPRLLVARGKATPLAHHSLDVREVVVLVFLSFSFLFFFLINRCGKIIISRSCNPGCKGVVSRCNSGSRAEDVAQSSQSSAA